MIIKKIVYILLVLGASLKTIASQTAEKERGIYHDFIGMHLEDQKSLAKKFKTLHEQDLRIPELYDIAQYNINHYGDENINWHKVIDLAQQIAADPQKYIDQNRENEHDNSVYLHADENDKDDDEADYEYDEEEDDLLDDEEKEIDPREEAIDLALKSHSYLRSGFDLFRQKLGSFKKFLELYLAYDDEDANFGEVIAQARDVLSQALVKDILRYVDLDSSYPNYQSYRDVSSLADYIMNYKDINELEHRELLEELFKGITAQSSVYEVISAIKDTSLRKLLIYIKSQEQGIVEQTSQVDYDFEYFIKAIKNNKMGVVRGLLELHKFDVNGLGMSSNPLYVAVDNGRTEIVRLLLAQPGIDINGLDIWQKSITFESHFKLTRIVDLLFKQPGIDVDGLRVFNPLYTAAGKGYIEIVKLLLAQPGIDVNGLQNFNPLYRTERERSLYEVSGFNISHVDISLNPLYAAVGNGHIEIVKLLLAQPGINVNGLKNLNPLYAASMRGYREIVELLLAHPEIQVNKKINWYGKSSNPLLIAIENNRRKIAELLRNAGAHE